MRSRATEASCSRTSNSKRRPSRMPSFGRSCSGFGPCVSSTPRRALSPRTRSRGSRAVGGRPDRARRAIGRRDPHRVRDEAGDPRRGARILPRPNLARRRRGQRDADPPSRAGARPCGRGVATVARRKSPPARRRPVRIEGRHRYGGDQDDRRLAAVRGTHTGEERDGRAVPGGCGRRPRRQAPNVRVRSRPDEHDAQSVEPVSVGGRIVLRLGGGGGGARVAFRPRDRHGRIDPDPRCTLRRHRAQTDLRPRPA